MTENHDDYISRSCGYPIAIYNEIETASFERLVDLLSDYHFGLFEDGAGAGLLLRWSDMEIRRIDVRRPGFAAYCRKHVSNQFLIERGHDRWLP